MDAVRRKWLIRMIVAKCSHREQARFLAEQACDGYYSLGRLPDADLVRLNDEIDRERECAEFGHTPHGFVRARRG